MDEQVGAEHGGRFVFHDVGDLVGVFSGADRPHLAAPDGTAHAGRRAQEEMLALARVADGLGFGAALGPVVPVGKGAHLVGPGHRVAGPGGGQLPAFRACGDFRHGVPGGRREGGQIPDLHQPSALDGDALEILGPHHRARAAPARLPVVLAADQREPDPVFPGGADGDRAGFRRVQLRLHRFVGGQRTLAPQASGLPERHLVIGDGEVDGRLASPEDQQAVVSGVFDLLAEASAEEGIQVGAGGGGFGDHAGPHARGRGSREGAGQEHQRIFRREGVHAGRGQIEEQLGPEALSADEIPFQPIRNGDGPARPKTQVHGQESAHVGVIHGNSPFPRL